jgi:hypothetical protein
MSCPLQPGEGCTLQSLLEKVGDTKLIIIINDLLQLIKQVTKLTTE